jgi:peptidoglycan/xylan/chitin deacetylase (PgdA/CDA1 family)
MEVVVTTSWDDGTLHDLRLAELLARYGVAATFYVPVRGFAAESRLSDADLRSLARAGFEIGSHGISHRLLDELDPHDLELEIGGSKEQLEQIIGVPVLTFCYPNGRHNSRVVETVRSAGYAGARTTRMLCSNIPDRFRMPTTLQAYPHRRATYVRNAVRGGNFTQLWQSYSRLCPSWVQTGRNLFQDVVGSGGVWHLYGHSWEIEREQLWPQLEQLLQYVSGRKGVAYRTNGQTLQTLLDDTTAMEVAAA